MATEASDVNENETSAVAALGTRQRESCQHLRGTVVAAGMGANESRETLCRTDSSSVVSGRLAADTMTVTCIVDGVNSRATHSHEQQLLRDSGDDSARHGRP